MRNELATAITIALLSAGLSACGGSGESQSGQTASTEADSSLTEKLQPFITCLNDVDSELQDDIQAYRAHFEEISADPTKSSPSNYYEAFAFAPNSTGGINVRKCIKDLKAAAEQSPANAELDNLGRDYATALEKLIPLADTADVYYDQKDYIDDRLAKGKTLDAQIAPLLTKLNDLSTKLHKIVDDHQSKIAEAELATIEKEEGKAYRWHIEKVMLDARRSVDKIDAAISKDGKVDIARVKDAEAQIQQAYDAAVAYAKANPSGNGSQVWLTLKDYTERYLEKVKTLRREAEAGKTNYLESNLRDVVGSFNTLVGNYNNQAAAQ